jgi:hypothetical protein
MTQQHPIIPPSEELVASMIEQAFGPLGPAGLSDKNKLTAAFADLSTRAAQWGADQELEACCKALESWNPRIPPNLRAARRPPPQAAELEGKTDRGALQRRHWHSSQTGEAAR